MSKPEEIRIANRSLPNSAERFSPMETHYRKQRERIMKERNVRILWDSRMNKWCRVETWETSLFTQTVRSWFTSKKEAEYGFEICRS